MDGTCPFLARCRRRPRQPWRPVVLMSSVKHLTHDWDVLHARQREVD
jgi:hypothetical protein